MKRKRHIRSSCQEVLSKKVFLEISQNSQEITCARFKKEALAQVFPVNFMKFLRTRFLTEHLWWLLLTYVKIRDFPTACCKVMCKSSKE